MESEGGARFVLVAEPAGFEEFVSAIGEPATAPTLPPAGESPDLERLAGVAAEHGITILGPPPVART